MRHWEIGAAYRWRRITVWLPGLRGQWAYSRLDSYGIKDGPGIPRVLCKDCIFHLGHISSHISDFRI